MKFVYLVLINSAFYSTQTHAAFRPDLRENVQVAELEPDQRVSDSATEIPLKAYPGSDFEIAFKCTDETKQFTFADHKHWVACCHQGQRLLVRSYLPEPLQHLIPNIIRPTLHDVHTYEKTDAKQCHRVANSRPLTAVAQDKTSLGPKAQDISAAKLDRTGKNATAYTNQNRSQQ